MELINATKLLDALRLTTRILFGVALANGIILFSPSGIVDSLGLVQFRTEFRPWLGGALVASGSLFLSAVLADLGKLLYPALLEHWNARQWIRNLHELSPAERQCLARFVDSDSTTQSFHISDGVVGGLVAKGILFRSSSIGHPGSLAFDYNIQPWAWRYLQRHRDLVSPKSE